MYARSADAAERELATRLEAAAVAAAAEVITLSQSDVDFVAKELAPAGASMAPKVPAPGKSFAQIRSVCVPSLHTLSSLIMTQSLFCIPAR